MKTSRSGRNPGFGCPPEVRHEPWDRLPVVFVLGSVLVQEFALLKRCENLIQQDVQKCQQKNCRRPGQESHAQDHQHVEQVARMAHAPVNPRANHSAQAMLRVEFRSGPPSAASRRRAAFARPASLPRRTGRRPTAQVRALRSSRREKRLMARNDDARGENQPDRQRHPNARLPIRRQKRMAG